MQKPFDTAQMLENIANEVVERDFILASREKTHGPYNDVADFAQTLKTCLHSHKGWGNLTAPQRESMEMICTKIARIMCGNPDLAEHWIDISGYAKLVAEILG